MRAAKLLLSERMKHVAQMVSACKTAADVGCDHGYIAIYLIRTGRAEHVIATDVNRGPLERAEENIRAYGMTDRIETRLSDGMEALHPGEAQSAVIAGMGGRLVCRILEKSLAAARQMRELILQPQSELHMVRGWLRGYGFAIEAEDMVWEDGKFYPMMRAVPAAKTEPDKTLQKCRMRGTFSESVQAGEESAERAESGEKLAGQTQAGKLFLKAGTETETAETSGAKDLQQIEDRYGPCLLAAAHPVLSRYLQKERDTCEEILRSLAHAAGAGEARRRELSMRLRDNRMAAEYMEAMRKRDRA